jgi:hypothetical protein
MYGITEKLEDSQMNVKNEVETVAYKLAHRSAQGEEEVVRVYLNRLIERISYKDICVDLAKRLLLKKHQYQRYTERKAKQTI